jgi:hypothetical protein
MMDLVLSCSFKGKRVDASHLQYLQRNETLLACKLIIAFFSTGLAEIAPPATNQ